MGFIFKGGFNLVVIHPDPIFLVKCVHNVEINYDRITLQENIKRMRGKIRCML